MMPRNRLVPLIVACALFMEQLDATVITTALPAIASSFHVEPLLPTLAITAYLLSLAIFIPLSGWTADRFGARRVFRSAIIIFVLGSIGCAFAPSLGALVLARMLQGMGGAMMVPVGRLVLLREIPKSELVVALSYLTIPALLAPVLGPPVGGFIITYVSWRWIFLINVPIGILGWLLVTRFIRDIRAANPPPLDPVGWLVLGSGVAALVLALETVGKSLVPWPVELAACVMGIVLLGVYVHHARRRERPIISLQLLWITTFRVSVYGGSLYRISIGAFNLLLPMLMQLGFGMSALHSGLITFSGSLGALFMKAAAKPMTRHFGFRRLLVWNGLLCAVTMMACATLRQSWPEWTMIGFLLLTGFARSLQFTSLNAIAFADVPERQMSQATSFSAMAQQLALSLGVCCASQLLNVSRQLRQAAQLQPLDFSVAFLAVGGVVLLSVLNYRHLRLDAGESVSGHQEKPG